MHGLIKRRLSTAACLSVAAIAIALVGLVLWRYPLPAWPLSLALLGYAAALWRWPALFLIVLPIALPAIDLGLWTGWMVVAESDLFVLVTVAVLLIRNPPTATDLWPGRAPAVVLLLLIAALVISTNVGLASPLGYVGHSDNPYLRPDNALRLAKGFVEALVLLLFMRSRQRTHGDALQWLAWGMAAGLIAVTLAVLVERALFTGILDFTADYRVAGPFSSMRVGGGHIGAYVALALPFLLGLHARRARLLATPVLLLAGLCGAYTLAVTYARTAYAAGFAGLCVATCGWWLARIRRGGAAAFAIVPIVLILTGLATAASSGVMRNRFANAAIDLVTREANWRAGWAVRDHGPLTVLFGMGLGTYQRAMLDRSPVDRPSDLSVETGADGRFVSIRTHSPFYLGQKVVVPSDDHLRLTLQIRASDTKAALGVALCDKVLLYSDNCRLNQVAVRTQGVWQPVSLDLPTKGLGHSALAGLVRRPVELSVFDTAKDTSLDIRQVQLTTSAGAALLANGDFAHGLDRWIFTDDSHVSWRILNQYLMLLFETGAFGVAALLAVSGLAFAGGLRAALKGDPIGAPVMGAVTAFLISCLFDNLFEAPRLTTLFFLVCGAGLILWQRHERPAVRAYRVRTETPSRL